MTLKLIATKRVRVGDQTYEIDNVFLVDRYLGEELVFEGVAKVHPSYHSQRELLNIKTIRNNNAKSIALFSDHPATYSGGRYFVIEIAAALRIAGYKVTCYSNLLPDYRENFDMSGIKWDIKASYHSFINYEILADYYLGFPVYGNTLAVHFAKKFSGKSYCMIFDPLPLLEKTMKEDLQMESRAFNPMVNDLEEANVILTMTNYSIPYILNWFKAGGDIRVLRPAVNSNAIEFSEKKPKRIGYVGRMLNRKKPKEMIEIIKRFPDYEFVIIGDYLVDGAEDISKCKNVKVYKHLTDIEKFKILSSCSATINTSHFEGFGMWAIESLACGVPVACYDLPIVREAVKRNSNVYFAKLGNVEDLIIKLRTALTVKMKPCEKFNFSTLVDQIQEVFD